MLTQLIKEEFSRRIQEESQRRIQFCISQLTEEEVWRKPNDHTNSVGNLVLHLCGNGRQWILSSFGNIPDERIRHKEFDPENRVSKSDLESLLVKTIQDLVYQVNFLTAEDLESWYEIQCFRDTGVAVLIHVIEHFSYHTGQITLLTKLMKNMDTGYYDGLQLEIN